MSLKNNETIVKLNNHNYFNWKYRMELLLIKENLWDVITQEAPTGDRPFQRWIKRDNQARALIGLSVEDEQLVHIRGKTSGKETWIAIKEVHEKDTLVNKVHLIKRICNLKMNENGNAENHINQLSALFQRLLDLGDTQLSDDWKVGILLSSLPKTYASLVTALEVRAESDLTWSLVHTKVLDEFERQREMNSDSSTDEKILKISKSDKICSFCKRNNHKIEDCIKLKQYKQFKEFQHLMAKEKEEQNEIKRANEINDGKEDEVLLCISSNVKNKRKERKSNKNNQISLLTQKILEMESCLIDLKQELHIRNIGFKQNYQNYSNQEGCVEISDLII